MKLQHAAAILWQRKRCSIIGFPPCLEGRRNDDFHGIPRFSLRWCRVWHHTSPQASVIISVSILHHFVYAAVGCILPEVLFRNDLTKTTDPRPSPTGFRTRDDLLESLPPFPGSSARKSAQSNRTWHSLRKPTQRRTKHRPMPSQFRHKFSHFP